MTHAPFPCRACAAAVPAPPRCRHDGFDVFRCPACGSLQVHPVPAGETLAAYYNQPDYFRPSQAARPGGYTRDYVRLQRSRRREYDELLGWLASRGRRGRLLELGCAHGFFLDCARRRGWRTAGVELSAEAVRYARADLGLDVIQGDAHHLDGFREPFDAVVLLDMIEHVTDPIGVLGQCRARLAEGGLVLIRTPNASSRGARRRGPRWAQIVPPGHLTLFTRDGLAAALRRAGLTPVAWRQAGGLGLWSGLQRRRGGNGAPSPDAEASPPEPGRRRTAEAGRAKAGESLRARPLLYDLTRYAGRLLGTGDMVEVLAVRRAEPGASSGR